MWTGRAGRGRQNVDMQPLIDPATRADWKKVLANLWNRKRIPKKARAGRGQESKWEIPIESGEMMRIKVILLLSVLVAAVGMAFLRFHSSSETAPAIPQPSDIAGDLGASNLPMPVVEPVASAATAPVISGAARPSLSTNKLERLAQIRESFRSLAAGEAGAALRAAKQLTNSVEREAALMALVTEWQQGELSSPEKRAWAIARYGLDAGLGMELAGNPELALLWANELTEGQARFAVIQSVAAGLLSSDPAGAFALSSQFPQEDRQEFNNALFASWAGLDTGAALDWAQGLADPAERDLAIQAIQTVAPVGIGTALAMRDGYPVIANLLPGTPAQLGGQLQPGDIILAVAQDGAAFVDTKGLPMEDIVNMIRGSPGSLVQLQVQPADASSGTPPYTISIVRDQLKFKTANAL